MEKFFDDYKLTIGEGEVTAINNAANVYQDGTTPFWRDVDGKLWAISGHSHLGDIAMFCGESVADLRYQYPAALNFKTGHADYAFSGVCYPEGVKARGSVWLMGLYICPKTHRFFAFIHNETGWCGQGTQYDAFGLCETPRYDSDFRHIGLMYSDDEGKTWTFDRWVLTAENVCFTEKYVPECTKLAPQKAGIISLGSGDFTLFADTDGRYLYLVYNIVRVDMDQGVWDGCDVYIARSKIREDGKIDDFVKYYEGSFCQPGTFGKETPIAKNSWHARVAYSKAHGCYLMSSTRVNARQPMQTVVDDAMQIRAGKTITEWSEPTLVYKDKKEWGNHYIAIVSDSKTGDVNHLPTDEFFVLVNHNGTDVKRHKAKLEKTKR